MSLPKYKCVMLPIFSQFKTLVMQSHAFPFPLRVKDMLFIDIPICIRMKMKTKHFKG